MTGLMRYQGSDEDFTDEGESELIDDPNIHHQQRGAFRDPSRATKVRHRQISQVYKSKKVVNTEVPIKAPKA